MLLLIGCWVVVALAQDVVRGEALAGLAGCASCHTLEGEAPFGGGYPIETTFGVYYGSNITPDKNTGIGDWGEAEFVDALRTGRSPSGRPYVPAFPYASFTKMSDADLKDIFAYLKSQEPVQNPNREHEVPWLYRSRLGISWWRGKGFQKGPYVMVPEQSEAWNRGRYLSDAVGHCGECHTPRNGVGIPRKNHYLAGNRTPPEPGPNITPHVEGLKTWSRSDWMSFLELGMTPSGNFVGGEMGRIVEEGTAPLTADDRAAITEYLLSVPPKPRLKP